MNFNQFRNLANIKNLPITEQHRKFFIYESSLYNSNNSPVGSAGGRRSSVSGPVSGLKMVFNTGTIPVSPVDDVNAWNTFFDTTSNADSDFDEISVNDNEVILSGATNLNIPFQLFSDSKSPSNNIVSIEDQTGIVVSISDAAFNNCNSLTSVSLPYTTSIGFFVFGDCNNLTYFNMPELVTSSAYCFYNCSSLTSLNLPNLTALGQNEFYNCTSLSIINLPSCTSLGGSTGNDYAFSGITGQTITLTIPEALMTCNNGEPDGDIDDLLANNTLTITTV
jgi:hypothetical protein